MLRRILLLSATVILAAICSSGVGRVGADDQNAVSIIDGLQDFAGVADSLSDYDALGDQIPLTDKTPSELLGLDDLFEDAFNQFDAPDDDSLAALEQALENDLDGSDADAVNVVLGCDGSCDAGEDPVAVSQSGDVISVHVPVNATKNVPVDLSFSSDAVELDGGQLAIDLSLSTTLDFELNTAVLADPSLGLGQAFSIVGEPTLSFDASVSAGSLTSFTALLGFTEVTVTGTVNTLSFGVDVTFEDPEGALVDPKISLEELTTTALVDLVSVALSSSPSLDAVVTFDSDLISGTSDGTLTFNETAHPLGDDFTFNLGDLESFRNMTPEDAFAALQRLNSWLDGLQAGGALDVELPLVNGTYTDVLRVGTKLAEALEGTPETACGGSADDDSDGRVNDGCAPVGATAEQGDECANSTDDDGDSSVNDGCPAAGGLLKHDDPSTLLDEEGEPTFDNAQELGQLLGQRLGIAEIVPQFANNQLTYSIDFSDATTATNVPVNFGGQLDVLSGISVDPVTASTDFGASYNLDVTFGLSLEAQPTEDGASIGSCEDGIDNSGDGATDAADSDCASLKTIEQRAFVDVGTSEGSPEFVAGVDVAANNIDAAARIGILEVGIEDASLAIATTQEEDGGGAGSCTDGVDNGGGDGIDFEDPDCAVVVVDLTDTTDGILTIEDMFNAMGSGAPAGVSFDLEAHIGIDGTVPVAATLGSQSLAGGDIVITGALDGDLTAPDDFASDIDIDGSDLSTSDLFNFSPCGTGDDEDGDGKVNDGCAQVGTAPETGADCDNATDDDSDGSINDGCPAVSDPESSSIALLDRIVDLIRQLAAEFDDAEGDDTLGSSLSDALPLVGNSFNDLLSYADTLESLGDDMTTAGEDPATECGNTSDDDHDGVVNDGCPTQGGVAEGGPVPGNPSQLQCANTTDDEDNDTSDGAIDHDGFVNDGCPPVIPTLQRIEAQVEGLIADALDSLQGGGTTVSHAAAGSADLNLAITLNSAEDELLFELDVKNVSIEHQSVLNLDLSALAELTGKDLVGVDSSGQLVSSLDANLDLDFGIDLDDYSVFMLGSTQFGVEAEADADDIVLEAMLGPLTLNVGTETPSAEDPAACVDTMDSDGDGFVNDGCPIDEEPETGGDCGNDADDDGDGAADDGCGESGDPAATGAAETACDDAVDDDGDGLTNDGCDAQAAKGRVHLGARFDVVEQHGDTDRVALDDVDFSGTGTDFAGVAQTGECPGDEPACAILPLYFEGAALGDEVSGSHQIVVTIANLDDVPGTISITYPDKQALLDAIEAQLLDLLLIESGLSDFFNTITTLLNGEIFGFELPLVGDQLDEATAFVDRLETDFLSAIQDQGDPLGSLAPTANASDVEGALGTFQQAIFDAIGPSSDVDILLDTNGDGNVTVDDFDVRVFCGGAECVAPETTCDEAGGTEAANDNDGDGVVNDGCPQVGDVAESGEDCNNNTDDDTAAESAGSLEAPDDRINDGCYYPAGFDPPATEVDEVRIYARLGENVAVLSTDPEAPPFELGIPGLSFKSQGGVGVNASWKLDLGISVSKDHGFSILTQEPVVPDGGDADHEPDPGTSADAETGADCTDNFADDDGDGVPNDGCGDELTLGGDVTLPEELEANIAFLYINVHDGHTGLQPCSTVGSSGETACLPAGLPAGHDPSEGASSFNAAFSVDIKDPGASPDGRLTFADLSTSPDFDEVVAFNFGAEADVNLHIETSIAAEASLPKLFADLHLDWRWVPGSTMSSSTKALSDDTGTSCDTNSDGVVDGSDDEISCLSLSLDGVALDAGTFLSQLVVPIVGDIQGVTKPLQPAIDVLQECIPVISDFSGQCVSLLTLAETLGPDDNTFDLLISLVKTVSFINGVNAAPGGDLTVPIDDGNFELDGAFLQRGTLAPSQAQSAFKPGEFGEFSSLLGAIDGEFGSLSNSEVGDTNALKEIGFSFPFLEHPEQIMLVAFGQDMDLVVYQNEASFGFEYSQQFGPVWSVPPVFMEVFGSVQFTARVGVGYDTEGLRRMLVDGEDAASLLHGLYLLDRNPDTNVDWNELELRGELGAGASVSVVIFEAGVRGGVFLTIGIDLNDLNDDGKLKFVEVSSILDATGNPFCLFIFNGEFGVFLRVFAEVDLFFWSQRWEKTLAEVVLLSFSVECDLTQEPILAREDPADSGVLILHVGAESDQRGSGSVGYNSEAEQFKVTQVADDTLIVSAFGFDQKYVTEHAGGWTKVVGHAGDTTENGSGDPLDAEDDEDVISLLDGVIGAEYDCKSGVQPCVAPGEGEDNGCATGNATDEDNDGLVNDGCPPVDEPETACDNAVDDDSDGFVNDGCIVNGTLVPFTVESELSGGPGNDRLMGGTVRDKINGGGEDDQIVARDGNNVVIGGPGDDQVSTGSGTDRILGDGGTDENDTSESSSDGDDSVEAGLGADVIYGQGGNDTLIGGISGATVIAVGAPETVAQCGNGQDDDNDGSADDGCSAENDGGDEIHAGSGTDDVNAGDGEDTVYGDDGADNIDGGPDNDTLYGGDENSPDQKDGAPETGDDCDNNVDDDSDGVPDDGCPGDVIVGGPGSDTIDAGGGDDRVIGGNLIEGEPDEGDAELRGGADDDEIFGDNVTFSVGGGGEIEFELVDADIGGADKMYGDGGDDLMRGQKGNDDMFGGDGADDMDGNAGEDFMFGDDGSINDRAAPDVTVSEDGSDGEDRMHGSEDNDHLYGGGADDTMFGDNGTDYMEGNGDDDTMRGGLLDDDMFGNDGNDDMFGDSGDDYMEGNAGADLMRGGIGQDDTIGGSSTAGSDDDEADRDGPGGNPAVGDEIHGDSNQDVVVGDNGTITRPASPALPDGTVARTVTLLDLACDDSTLAGDDVISGGSSNDDLYGGGEDDTIHGNAGDDYIEGNCGDDDLFGDNGQDDLIGGTSDESNGAAAGGGVPDGDDDMWGGRNGTDIFPSLQFDVMAGDNASITRPESGGSWITDDFATDATGVVRRTVTLYDVGVVGSAANAAYSGGDDMYGEAAFDIMYGQGGDDVMHGNAGDDHMEGNADDDTMYGDEGQDDLIGGTGRTGSDDPSTAQDGRLDEQDGDTNDTIYGGDGAGGVTSDDFDTIVGDNATIERLLDEDGKWEVNTFNAALTREIHFYDVGMAPGYGSEAGAGTNGDDVLRGEHSDDTMYGQGGDDDMAGGAGDDYMEGNDGSDTMSGNVGNDDMAGGTGHIFQGNVEDPRDAQDRPLGRDGRLDDGETSMSGGDGFDFMIGDNGVITRVLDENGAWLPNTFHVCTPLSDCNGVQHHPVVLRDVQLLGGTVGAGTSGGELDMDGDAQDDIMYGQGGNDEMFGGLHDDYMEGNHGNDDMYGNAGQDDMLGGGSDDSDIADTSEPDLLDGDDVMRGEDDFTDGAFDGSGPDAMIGDNGTIVRPLATAGEWQTNMFNDAVVRVLTLFDVENAGTPVDPALSGDDDLYGNDNDDTMYGQGGEDDMYGGSGDDYMEGNAHSDLMYGGPQQDDMIGGTGRTTSNDDSTFIPGRTDASTNTRNVPLGSSNSVNVPLGDTMIGDSALDGSSGAADAADVMIGDNGTIDRPLDESSAWIVQTYSLQDDTFGDVANRHSAAGSSSRIDRIVGMVDTGPGAVAGSDLMVGNAGDDDMYGGFDDAHPAVPNPDVANPLDPTDKIGDEMHGNAGEDAMAGDQGVFDNDVLPPPEQQHIEPKEPFIDDDIYTTGTLLRRFTLDAIAIGGNDRMRGGDDADSMHGGAGHDLMNGDTGNDRLFGDDGADDMWGGEHHDHLWGGYDYDQMDLHPRVASDELGLETDPCSPVAEQPDPAEWYVFGVDANCDGNFEGVDYMYGGWDADAMQANVGDNGPATGDRLIDWVGVYNLYVLCPGTYGEFVATREFSPALTDFMFSLVEADGAVNATDVSASGGNEIAWVYTKDLKANQQPPYEDTPAHFHCDNVEAATATPTSTPGGPTETPTATETPKPKGKKTDTPTATATASPTATATATP